MSEKMQEFDLTNIDGEYVRVKSNGTTLHLWVKDGKVTDVSVHGNTPEVKVFTQSKMTKQTMPLKGISGGWPINNCITLKVKE